MNVEKIWLDGLQIGTRLRDVDQAKVETLAASMSAIGLRQPISVWADNDGGVHLVAGLHRVKAAELLKWETIDAILVDMSDIDRRRWEIAENLHRSELKVLERDQHVAEWIKLTDKADQLAQVEPIENKRSDGRGHRKEAGTRKAARELGIEKEDARRAVKVASLTDEAKETAREVKLDNNRSALLRAAAQPPERQADELRRIAERKAVERSQEREIDRQRYDLSWTEDSEPSPEQLDAIRSLDDAALCAFLLKVEGLGLIAALRAVTRAAA